MRAFERVQSVVIPMPEPDTNTDEILPARFMSRPRQDYGRYFFHDRRFARDGSAREGFVLNDPRYRDARILLAGHNFGCGSSREHAVFTLADFGIRIVMAPSIADIFGANCFKNGVLAIAVPEVFAQDVLTMISRQPGAQVDVDLERQRVTLPTGKSLEFEIDAFRKHSLLRGLDDISRTLEFMADIERFEARRPHIAKGV